MVILAMPVFCRESSRILSRFDNPQQAMTEESRKSVSDNSLLNRFRSGDEDAALQLYYRYAERLLKLAKRETPQELATRFDPEDIVQSVFRTFFRRAASGQYEAPEGDELWKLLLVMALNKVRGRGAYHRADKRDIRRTLPIPDSDAGVVASRNSVGDDNEVARHILCLSVEEIISNQPESHRAVIRLRIDGMEVQEIALQEQRSKRTVERILQSFRKELIESALLSVGEAAE
jgi:RNA polymerase sigma-70 factor (ECF subfamily)